MTEVTELIKDLQDPQTRQDALDAVKSLSHSDFNELIQMMRRDPKGLSGLFTLITGQEKPIIDENVKIKFKRKSEKISSSKESVPDVTFIQQYWCNSSIPLDMTCDNLYPEDPKFGMVIGTYAAVPYIHLQLEARKRFYPHVPVLVHDDCSGRREELRKLCDQYGCDFEYNSKRQPHHYGDLTAFIGGLKWAESKRLDILLKVSRRWIFLTDWTKSLLELARESQYATFSNYTISYAFGFRTECVALSVKKWADNQVFYQPTIKKMSEGNHIFVENYIHNFAIEFEKNNCNQARKWHEQNPVPHERSGYAPWPLMGNDRSNNKSGDYLWHDSNPPREYAERAILFGLPYKEDNFNDPNQGEGIGTSNKFRSESVDWKLELPFYNINSSWDGHKQFGMALVDLIRPKMFVELGVHTGGSYFSFCHAVQRLNLQTKCFAVDHWYGDPHSGHYDENVYIEFLKRNNIYGFSTILRMEFDEAVKKFEDNSINILHIDGYHTYEVVKHDWEIWKLKLHKDGVVLFHDTVVQAYGVHKLFDEIKHDFVFSHNFKHSYGLGVLSNCDLSDLVHEYTR